MYNILMSPTAALRERCCGHHLLDVLALWGATGYVRPSSRCGGHQSSVAGRHLSYRSRPDSHPVSLRAAHTSALRVCCAYLASRLARPLVVSALLAATRLRT